MWEPTTHNLQRVAAGAAWSALNALQPVRVAAAEGVSTISVNRRYQRPGDGVVVVGRNWDGVRDRRRAGAPLRCARRRPRGRRRALRLPPDHGRPRQRPDHPGLSGRGEAGRRGSDRRHALFLQGAAGDVGPVRGVAADGANQYKRLGTILGLEAARLWWEADPVPTTETYTGTLESGAPLADLRRTQPIRRTGDASGSRARIVELPAREAEDADRPRGSAGSTPQISPACAPKAAATKISGGKR